MTSTTHEHTLNVALGEVLGLLRRSWKTRSEQTGQVLAGGGRPDILIEEASGWPVSIARTYGPVVARVIEPPCGPVDGLLSPLGLRVNHLLSVEQGPVG